MRCEACVQSLKVHFCFLGGAPPRRGSDIVRVEEGVRNDDIGCWEVVERCLPAWRRRMVGVGRVVRRDRRWQSVGRVVSLGMVRGIARRRS